MGIINTLLEIGDAIPVIIVSAIMVTIVVILALNIKIVPQATASVVECLGKYKATWHTGLHFKIPFVEKVVKRLSLMEQIEDFDPQLVITKDNVVMQVDTVVFYQITDPKLYSYGHATPMTAIENLTSTTLRNIIGEMELDSTLTSRDIINSKMRSILDEATDPWGIKVSRVELKNIIPPKEIQDAMEKQMKAERERREAILRAEGEKNSAILVAEGRKQSQILDAEAEKQSQILRAEAEKQSQVLRAEGEAEAILAVQRATAEGIRMINEANPGEGMIAIKSLETFEKVADGQATKIIIPSEIQNIAGLVASIKGVAEDDKKA